MNLASRLTRLEAKMASNALHVVTGHSEAEHDDRIAELVAAGRAMPSEIFVCIMKRSIVPGRDD